MGVFVYITKKEPVVNSLALERCGCYLKFVIFKLISTHISSISYESGLRWMIQISLMIGQLLFELWIGAIRQQAITRANVDPDFVPIWRHWAKS